MTKKISKLNVQETVKRLDALVDQGCVVLHSGGYSPISANARHLTDRLVALGRSDLVVPDVDPTIKSGVTQALKTAKILEATRKTLAKPAAKPDRQYARR